MVVRLVYNGEYEYGEYGYGTFECKPHSAPYCLSVALRTDVVEWMQENAMVLETLSDDQGYHLILTEGDAVAFKLRWF